MLAKAESGSPENVTKLLPVICTYNSRGHQTVRRNFSYPDGLLMRGRGGLSERLAEQVLLYKVEKEADTINLQVTVTNV